MERSPVPVAPVEPGTATPAAFRLWEPSRPLAALAGLAVTALALGAAELVAGIGRRAGMLDQLSSPLLALGQAFIALTPEWLKQFAIETFGERDKIALQVGMAVVVVVLALVVGLVARRSPRAGALLLAGLVALAGLAVVTRPAGTGPLDLAPSLIGGFIGVASLGMLFRRTADMAAVREVMDSGGASPAVVPPTPRPRPELVLERRSFLRLVALAAGTAAATAALGRLLPSGSDVAASRAALSLPPATPQTFPAGVDLSSIDQAVLDQPPFLTPNEAFYRIDTALAVPAVTAEGWRLRVHGLCAREIELSYDDLVDLPQVERTITLTCVSNEVGGSLVGTATWTGTLLQPLLEQVGPDADADCVLCTSADGFTLTAPLEALVDGRDAMLVVGMNGEILPREHGFPVRMVVPGLYGYVSATKWVVDMKLTRFADEVAYWTQRGWAERAPIKTASRIDVPRGFRAISAGEELVIAGVAWAQHRGIGAVEVQIDDGAWEPAELGPALSDDTWRQWRTTWIAEPGVHTVRCRARDGDGELQDEREAPPVPDGATGYDSRQLNVS